MIKDKGPVRDKFISHRSLYVTLFDTDGFLSFAESYRRQ